VCVGVSVDCALACDVVKYPSPYLFAHVHVHTLSENHLLHDQDGYIKITDFGFAQKINDGLTSTLCGTCVCECVCECV
jgi:hypothetical protein